MNKSSAELHIAFIEALGVASRKMRTLYDARVSRLGLTFSRARVLTLLAKHELCSQSVLACELELEKPTLVRTLDRMAELDMIERVPDPNDRRVNLVQLRPHGKQMAEKLLVERELFAATFFTAEDDAAVQDTIILLQTIVARIDRLERES